MCIRDRYKNNLMNKNPNYGPGSGFSADYHFFLEKGFRPTKMDVTAEQYTLCRVEINGVAVPWLENEHYLDEHFGVADITAYLKDGENVVTVVADTFDVRLELESVYLPVSYTHLAVYKRQLPGLAVNHETVADDLHRFRVHPLAQLGAGFPGVQGRVFLHGYLDQLPGLQRVPGLFAQIVVCLLYTSRCV